MTELDKWAMTSVHHSAQSPLLLFAASANILLTDIAGLLISILNIILLFQLCNIPVCLVDIGKLNVRM